MVSVPSPRPIANACVLFHFETFLSCYLSAKRRHKMMRFLSRTPVCALIFQFSSLFYPTYSCHFNSKLEMFDAHLDAKQRGAHASHSALVHVDTRVSRAYPRR